MGGAGASFVGGKEKRKRFWVSGRWEKSKGKEEGGEFRVIRWDRGENWKGAGGGAFVRRVLKQLKAWSAWQKTRGGGDWETWGSIGGLVNKGKGFTSRKLSPKKPVFHGGIGVGWGGGGGGGGGWGLLKERFWGTGFLRRDVVQD